MQRQETAEAETAPQRTRGRGRTRFSQTPDYAEAAESLQQEVTTQKSRPQKNRPSSNRRPYEVEETIDEAPRRSRPRVVTESRFESQTPPQLFLPAAPTTPSFEEISLEAISKTLTTTKIEKSTEIVSEPANASSVDPLSIVKEEIPATEAISATPEVASENATRKGRLNVRLQGSSTESTTTASPRGRSRSNRRQEEVAQQTAPVAQVVHHPNARSNRGRGRTSAEVKDENPTPARAPVRVTKKLVASESRRNSEVKAPLDVTADERQDNTRRDARGYTRSNNPETASRTNIVRSNRRQQQDTEVSKSNSVTASARRNDRQERLRSSFTTEAPSRTPQHRNTDRRRGNTQSSTTASPVTSRSTPTDIRSRSRSRLLIPPVLDEQKLEVLPLFESETATVHIAPLTTTRRKSENEIPTTTVPRRTTPRHTTPKPKTQWKEETATTPKKSQVKETIQVSNVKEVTTKRKVVRRKKLEREGESTTAEPSNPRQSQIRTSTTTQWTERTTKAPSTTKTLEKQVKPVVEYFDRRENSYLQSTDFPTWGTSSLREKTTFYPDHSEAWLNFDKIFSEPEEKKNPKIDTPKANIIDRGKSFDFKNEILQDIPKWNVNYQSTSITTPSRRESTTALPTERRTTEKQYSDYSTEIRVKEKVKKKIIKATEASPSERRTNERARNNQENYDHRQQQYKTTVVPDRKTTSVNLDRGRTNENHYDHRGQQNQEKRTNDRIVSQESNDYRQRQQFKVTDAPEGQKEKHRIVIPIKVNEPRQKEKLYIKTTENPDKRTTEKHYRTSSTVPYDYRSKDKQIKSTTEAYDRRSSNSRGSEITERRKTRPLSSQDQSGRAIKQEVRLSALSSEISEGRSATRIITAPTTSTTTTTTPSTTSRTTRFYSTPEASSTRQISTSTDRQVTVSQVITKTRTSKSEGKKKKSDGKEEEDIDESDNYPEPFKALIQAKKEKDVLPSGNTVKVGV